MEVRLLARAIQISPNHFLSCEKVDLSHICRIGDFGDLVVITPNCLKGQCIVDSKIGMFVTKIPVSYQYGD